MRHIGQLRGEKEDFFLAAFTSVFSLLHRFFPDVFFFFSEMALSGGLRQGTRRHHFRSSKWLTLPPPESEPPTYIIAGGWRPQPPVLCLAYFAHRRDSLSLSEGKASKASNVSER